MKKEALSSPATILIIVVIALMAAIGCTEQPQSGVAKVQSVQDVSELFNKYRKTKAESPDQMTIFLERQEPETFHGRITKPIENGKVQMHLIELRPIQKDTYAECVLADRGQVFDAKVGEHVTIAGKLAEFADKQIKFTNCQIVRNHSR